MTKRVNAPQFRVPKGVIIVVPKPLTRDERVAWILKDQGLYDWWQRTLSPIDKFMQDNRIQIDECINRARKLEGH